MNKKNIYKIYLRAAAALLLLFSACDINGPDPVYVLEQEGMAAVRIKVEAEDTANRTVFPTVALSDVTQWILLGKTEPAADISSQLAEFSGTEGPTIYLEPQTWYFTLEGYKEGTCILRGTLDKYITLEGPNDLSFTVAPSLENSGNLKITINLPPGHGIDRVELFKDGNKDGTVDLVPADNRIVYESYSHEAGDYFFSFRLYKGSDLYGVVSERVQVGENLDTEKTYDLGLEDLNIMYEINYHNDPQFDDLDIPVAYRSTDKTITLATPSREGYTFVAWYDNENYDGEPVYEIPQGSMENKNFYAQWTTHTYMVQYDANGGSGTTEQSEHTYGEETALTANGFTREGYVFVEWNTQADGSGNNYADGAGVTDLSPTNNATVTLYAQWGYTITFESNGGSAVAPITAIAGTPVYEPTSPTRTNYTFKGWYDAPSGGTAIVWPYTPNPTCPDTTVPLYAQWGVTITFESHSDESYVPSQTADVGDTVPEPTPPARTGYTFNGWFLTESGGTAIVWPYTATVNVTMHAQWTPITYTVKYDPNGGEGNGEGNIVTSTHTYDQAKTLTPISFNKPGYPFGGWLNNNDGTSYTDGESVINLRTTPGEITLYAQWEATITFDSRGGSAVANRTVNIGTPVLTLPSPTRTNYTFKGWYTAASGGTRYTETYAPPAHVTMYAQWEATVNFHLYGDSYLPSITVDEGGTAPKPTDPTRTGYTFKGWYTAVSGGAKYTTWPHPVTGHVTMHAQWTAHTYTVQYDSNGGTGGSMVSSTHFYDQANTLTPNGFTRPGYVFLRWNTQADGSGTPYTDGQSVTNLSAVPDDTVTLYAQWAATITFDSKGGSAVTAITAREGTQVDAPTPPTWTGNNYTFKGWYDAASGGTAIVWPYTLSGHVTMYAQWEAVITFNSHGGSEVTAIRADKGTEPLINAPASPTLTGYTFKGWYDAASGGTKYTWPHTLSVNVTMHAQWTATVIFNGNGGSPASSSETVNAGDSLPEPATPPTRTGYIFNGWYSAASGGTTILWPYTPSGHVTLYAQWAATITFDSHGGSEIDPITATEMTTVTLPNPTWTGYTFQGWYSAATGGTSYGSSHYLTANVTMHAQWTVNTYTVAYDPNGGDGEPTASSSHTYDQDKTLTPNGFTRTGYTFAGWNTKQNGSGVSYTNRQNVRNLSADQNATVTLYAQWTAITYTVAYNANGGTGEPMAQISHTYDRAKQLTANGFSRSGYNFAGWNTLSNGSSTSYGDGQYVTNLSATQGATVTLYAQWAHAQFIITFDFDAGTGAFNDPGTTTIYKPNGSLSVSVNISAGYTNPRWELDGEPRGTENSITINARDYSPGKHNLTLIISKSGISWSKELSFTVEDED